MNGLSFSKRESNKCKEMLELENYYVATMTKMINFGIKYQWRHKLWVKLPGKVENCVISK